MAACSASITIITKAGLFLASVRRVEALEMAVLKAEVASQLVASNAKQPEALSPMGGAISQKRAKVASQDKQPPKAKKAQKKG